MGLAVLRDAASQVQSSSESLAEGISPLELAWVLIPFPPKLSGCKYRLRSKCAHLHFITCPRWVNAGNKNTPSMHHPQRRNVTTSIVGFKTRSHNYAKVSPKNGEPQRYSRECRTCVSLTILPCIMILLLLLVRPCDVVALHFHCAPLAQCIWLRFWFSCPSFPLIDNLPTKAKEHPLPWFY